MQLDPKLEHESSARCIASSVCRKYCNGVNIIIIVQVDLLRRWLTAAKVDVSLIETLLGTPIHKHKPLSEALESTGVASAAANNSLRRTPQVTLSSAFLQTMRTALESADKASPYLRTLCEGVVYSARQRIDLLQRLKVCTLDELQRCRSR